MRSCHFQDRPGKHCLCLRGIGRDSRFEAIRWSNCEGGDDCPHRAWDPAKREEITTMRMDVLGSCEQCGAKHDTFSEQLDCLMTSRLSQVIFEIGPPTGSREPLLIGKFPRSMMDKAWRKVRSAVVHRDGHICGECGRDLRQYPSWYTEVHHIIPVMEGGSDRPENLITLCVECHGNHTDRGWCRPSSERPEVHGNSHRKKRTLSQTVLDPDNSQ